jgi:hypothetical protein
LKDGAEDHCILSFHIQLANADLATEMTSGRYQLCDRIHIQSDFKEEFESSRLEYEEPPPRTFGLRI